MNGSPQVMSDRQSDWLLYENCDIGRYSRDVVTVAINQTLLDGQVVGKNAAGEVMAYDNETSTSAGGAVATGIMCGSITTGAATAKGVMLAREARVVPGRLKYAAGLITADKDAAIVDLAALGIIAVPAEV